MFKIETGIPLPAKQAKEPSEITKAVRTLANIGESFLVPVILDVKETTKIRAAATMNGKRISIRQVDDGTRVWLTGFRE